MIGIIYDRNIFQSISDPVFGMLDFGSIFCDALSPRPDGVSYSCWTFLNMGGVDLSNAFGMRKIDFQEDFQLEWEKNPHLRE